MQRSIFYTHARSASEIEFRSSNQPLPLDHRHAVAFAARGPELGMSAGDWCQPVCKGFGRLRLSFQSMAIYPSGVAAK